MYYMVYFSVFLLTETKSEKRSVLITTLIPKAQTNTTNLLRCVVEAKGEMPPTPTAEGSSRYSGLVRADI